MRLDAWIDFLKIDRITTDNLEHVRTIVEPHIDAILDIFYAHVATSPAAAALFASPASQQRARAAQKAHWLSFVLAGRLDDQYLAAARAIGDRHFRAGVDLLYYTGAYALVLNEIGALLCAELHDRPVLLKGALHAVNRAIFLDMGLAVSVYYDDLVGAVERMSNDLAFSLARAGDFRDNETGMHLLRMSGMCQALARVAGKDAKWASLIAVASPLHDVGKIGIPDRILLKPGRLVGEEVTIMQRHPAIGGEIIPDSKAEVIHMARRIALTHHERWDGAGYPIGLRGQEIPIEGRITAICDVYDALLSKRPYKEPWTREAAIAYLEENAGKHFDPGLVSLFLSILPEIDAVRLSHADSTALEM